MPDISLNLIIKKDKQSPFIRKLNIILPIFSALSISLFVIVFLFSIIYANNNILQFNLSKREIEQLENKISTQKNLEGIYTLTTAKLKVLTEITSGSKDFYKLISEIDNLKTEGIAISSITSDKLGNLTLSVAASSSGTLDNFVNLLMSKEQKKLFKEIQASGIVREQKGSYLLNINLRADDSLLR